MQPIRIMRIPDEIIARIKAMIVSGTLTPGEKLPTEHQLAEMLGVGRPAVREAIQALAHLGLLRRSRDGTYVNEVTWDVLSEPLSYLLAMDRQRHLELFECRKIMEVELAGLAAERRNETNLETMGKLVDSMERPGISRQDFVRLNVSFHEEIAVASQNGIMRRFLGSLSGAMSKSQMELSAAPGAMESSMREHREILEAIIARDAEAARRAMTRHLERAERILLDLCNDRYPREG